MGLSFPHVPADAASGGSSAREASDGRPAGEEPAADGSRLVLVIGGSDSCGGAGIQADLRTIHAFGLRAGCAITALTAQDPDRVHGIACTAPEFVVLQARAVIGAGSVAAIKTGMLANAAIVSAVASLLAELAAGPGCPPLVVDPVMVATSGARLLDDGGELVLIRRLLPLATVVTPNLLEAAVLLGEPADSAPGWTRDEQAGAALRICDLGARAVLVKGGHRLGVAADVLAEDGITTWFEAPRVDGLTTHGTGCTLAAGIAACLALDQPLPEAIGRAKEHLTRALARGLDRPLPAESR